MKKINLGDKVQDLVNGFTGIAIARTDYLYGNTRYGVQSKELKDGKPMDIIWLDEAQLSVVEASN